MQNYKVQFEQKPVTAIQTVAELFRFAREEQRFELEEIADHLQISPLYLESLEKGAYESLPCLVYTRNFVKCYGQKLGLNLAPLMELFEKEWELFQKHQQRLIQIDDKGVGRRDLWRMPRWIRWASATVVISSIFVYLGSQLYILRQPPMLTIHTPEEEVMTESQLIQISGQTEPEVALSINSQTILSDVEGNFSEKVALQPGLNLVEIQAKKKYSQPNTVFRKIIVQDQPVITDAGGESLKGQG